MIVDPRILPGLLLLAAELAALAAVGYVVVRVALRQEDELSALAQGLVVGPALWGIVVNFVMYAVPGLAGAAVGWAVVLGLGAGLVWRSPVRCRLPLRTVAGFAGAVLALGWAALASRQLVGIANPYNDLGLAASIRAGAFPVAMPSSPEATSVYHYGASLLAGLLAPAAGPDLAFVWEILGVYAWAGFTLVVVTAVRRRGSWLTALLLAPLLLSYGLHTFVWSAPGGVAGIVGIPVPGGPPSAGLRASLAQFYWPPIEPVWSDLTSLPDVWMPAFPLGYAMTFVVLAHAARPERASWPGTLTLAGLVGFLGLLVTTLAPVVVVLWAGLEVLRLLVARRAGDATLVPALQLGAGLAVAGLLLQFGGGALSGVLSGDAGSSGLAWTRGLDASDWPVLGGFSARPGGIGLLSLGPVAVAGIATVLARRDRLVLALVGGVGMLTLAWLALEYSPRPEDLGRLAGHARNLALIAFLLAVGARLASLRARHWRYVAGALLAGLVIWPTSAAPARSLASTMGRGVQLANAGWAWQAALKQDERAARHRYLLPGMSSSLAAYLRDHTAVDARVLDTSLSLAVLINTGRSDSWGFADVIQLSWRPGVEHRDARQYLEPAALKRLDISYIFATDAWAAALPVRARSWLADPDFFDLLARDGGEALYRVRPAFLELEIPPDPESFQALPDAVPQAAVLYLPPQADWVIKERLLGVASAAAHARLVGTGADPEILHLRTPAPWTYEPLGAQVPELVALPQLHEAWQFPPGNWRIVWRNSADRVVVYETNEAHEPRAGQVAPAVRVRLKDVETREGRLRFTATLDDRLQQPWSGQDWVLVPVDASEWAIPFLRQDGLPDIEQWFAGQAAAGGGVTTHTYVFDARDSSLAVRGVDGAFTSVEASQRTPAAGTWMLALRLNRWVDRSVQDATAIVPALRFEVTDDGTVRSTQVYEFPSGWRPA